MKKSTSKKLVNTMMIIAVTVGVMFVGTKVVFGTESPFYIVSSGSMRPVLNVYDIIVVKQNIPFDQIKIGDIIAFNNPSNPKEIIVHRVVQILDQSTLAIRTKGDANHDSIPGTDLPITKDDYIGKVSYVIPRIGYITCILIPPINYVMIIAIIGIITVKPLTNKNENSTFFNT